MKKARAGEGHSARNIVITGATGDIAQEIIKRLPSDNLFLLSRSLPRPELPERVDILINNAGFAVFGHLEDLTDSEIDEMFRVNVLEAIQLTKKLRPTKLVNIASIAGKLPTEKSSIYAASKAALILFGEAMRLEGMQVLTVNTGPVRSKFHAANSAYLQKLGRRALTAEEVAEKLVRNLDSNKQDLTLPGILALAVRLRALFPRLVDRISQSFFNFK